METLLFLLPVATIIIVPLLFFLCISTNDDSGHSMIINKDDHNVMNKRNEKKEGRKRIRQKKTIGKRILSHPSNSDYGSPSVLSDGVKLSSKIGSTSTELTSNDLMANDLTPNISIHHSETMKFETIQSSDAVQAALQIYQESSVRKACIYLMRRGSYRGDARHIGITIEHIEELGRKRIERGLTLDEQGLPPDYSETDLCKICQERDTPYWIKQFETHNGFPPTPRELLDFKDNTHEKMIKNEEKLKDKIAQLAMKNGELEQQQHQDSLRILCKICFKNEVGTVLRPCDHAVLCVPCAEILHGGRGHYRRKECVICSVVVKSYSRMYLA